MRINMYIRNPKNQGITSIYFTITWMGNRLIYQACESILTSDWNSKKYEPKQNANNAPLIGRLAKAEQKIRDAFEKLEIDIGVDKITPKILKIAIQGGSRVKKVVPDKKERILIPDFIQTFIDDSTSGKRLTERKLKIKYDSIKSYGNVKQAFEQFQQANKHKYYLDQLNQDIIDNFETYLVETKKLALNTKSKYLQRLMLTMRYALLKKLVSKDLFTDLKVSNIREVSDNIYLNNQEIKELMEYRNPESPKHEYIRDMLVISCCTGLRHSDFSRLSQKNFFESRITTIQKKVGEKVVIPMHPLVKQILLKYPDGLPKCPSSQKFNDYLKEIGQEIASLQKNFEKKITRGYQTDILVMPKWKALSSHVGRRSFATNEFLNGTPESIIMTITGHKSSATFKAYIKASCEEKADLLEKEWEKRYNN